MEVGQKLEVYKVYKVESRFIVLIVSLLLLSEIRGSKKPILSDGP